MIANDRNNRKCHVASISFPHLLVFIPPVFFVDSGTNMQAVRMTDERTAGVVRSLSLHTSVS